MPSKFFQPSAESLPEQMDLCAPYGAREPDYRLVQWLAAEPARNDKASLSDVQEYVLRTHDYEHAVRIARDHCLLEGCAVWVVDFADGHEVVFRIHPDEYTARALGERTAGRTPL
jgi:hypothetical protein